MALRGACCPRASGRLAGPPASGCARDARSNGGIRRMAQKRFVSRVGCYLSLHFWFSHWIIGYGHWSWPVHFLNVHQQWSWRSERKEDLSNEWSACQITKRCVLWKASGDCSVLHAGSWIGVSNWVPCRWKSDFATCGQIIPRFFPRVVACLRKTNRERQVDLLSASHGLMPKQNQYVVTRSERLAGCGWANFVSWSPRS